MLNLLGLLLITGILYLRGSVLPEHEWAAPERSQMPSGLSVYEPPASGVPVGCPRALR